MNSRIGSSDANPALGPVLRVARSALASAESVTP
jgi:hypothetical protein